MSFGDIWEKLDFAALGAFEAHNGRWDLATNVVLMNLGAKIPLPDVLGSREPGVDSRQFMAEADFLFRVHRGAPRQGMRSFVDLVAGARYNEVSAQLETSVLPDTKRSFGWVDGVIGARFLVPLSGRVAIAAAGPTSPASGPTSPGRPTPTCASGSPITGRSAAAIATSTRTTTRARARTASSGAW